MTFRCPRCARTFRWVGPPTQNPGGLGAKPGHTCVFCVDEATGAERQAFAQTAGSPFANPWHPVYLEPCDNVGEADFLITRLETLLAGKTDVLDVDVKAE